MSEGEKLRYTMVIQWSDEDQAYLVSLPEWEDRIIGGPVATHGATYEEAVQNGQVALKALVGWAEQHGYPLPEPRVYAASV